MNETKKLSFYKLIIPLKTPWAGHFFQYVTICALLKR